MIYDRFVVPGVQEPPPTFNVSPRPVCMHTDTEIDIDVSQDPDPYCLHGIPVHERLVAMGWPVNLLPYLPEKNC